MLEMIREFIKLHPRAIVQEYKGLDEEEQQRFEDQISELHTQVVPTEARDTVVQRVFDRIKRITDALEEGKELDSVLNIIVEGVLAVFPGEELAASICAFDEERPLDYQFDRTTYLVAGNDTEQKKWMEEPPRNGYKRSPLKKDKLQLGTAMTALNYRLHNPPAQRAVYINNVLNHWPKWMPDLRNPRSPGVDSAAYLPLVVGDERVGIIIIQFSKTHRFSSEERRELNQYAKMAATVLYNTQLQRKLQFRSEKLHQMQLLTNEALFAVNLDTIVSKVSDFVMQFPFDNLVLRLPSEIVGRESQTFSIVRGQDGHPVFVDNTMLYPSSWLSQDDSYKHWKGSKLHKMAVSDSEWVWALGYNIGTKEQSLGSLFVTRNQNTANEILGITNEHLNREDVSPFLKQEIIILELLINQLELILGDINRKQRLANKSQIIARLAAILSESSELDRTSLFQLAAEHLVPVFTSEDFYIFSYNSETQEMTREVIYRNKKLLGSAGSYRKNDYRGFAEYIVDTAETIFIPNNLYESDLPAGVEVDPTTAPSAYLGVPIKRHNAIYGVIGVQDFNGKSILRDSDRFVLEAVAALISIYYQ